MSEDEAVCAQIKPDTVSVSDPVKLFPACRVDESLSVFRKPSLKRFLAGLVRDIVPTRLTPLVIILGQPELVLKDRAQFRLLFIIPDRIVERQSGWVNLIDRNMDVDVVGVVMNDAYPLMFSKSQLLAKTLLDHAQRVSIRIFAGSEGNEQMIGLI
jgi:hypothetical protein